jgi:hypothetical protein
MTSSATSRALGAAPSTPAAIPATNVPWPRPSPTAFGWRLVSEI